MNFLIHIRWFNWFLFPNYYFPLFSFISFLYWDFVNPATFSSSFFVLSSTLPSVRLSICPSVRLSVLFFHSTVFLYLFLPCFHLSFLESVSPPSSQPPSLPMSFLYFVCFLHSSIPLSFLVSFIYSFLHSFIHSPSNFLGYCLPSLIATYIIIFNYIIIIMFIIVL